MKCFYHTDNDGFCAGSLVAIYHQIFKPDVDFKESDFIKYNYDGDISFDRLTKGETVYFVDLSFKVSEYEIVKRLMTDYDFVWLDHHSSSMDLLKAHPELDEIKGIRSTEVSGAYLTYMYLWDIRTLGEVPYYVKLVSDYDTWTFDYGDQSTYFYLGTNTEDNFTCFSKLWTDLFYDAEKVLKIIEKGKVIKNFVDVENARYLKAYGYESEIDGHKCYVVNKSSNSWIFGDKYYEYPLVVVWTYDGKKYKYTLYSSDPNVNCQKIAEKFGGGGHKGAAGFTSSRLLLMNFK